uniref:Uncharacterized protein n=1 Tax=Alexandrium andersonii TaxID=327968 RepID=A0A7S2BUV1_9DINO
MAVAPTRPVKRYAPLALLLAAAWLLPSAWQAFALGAARGAAGRCPSLRRHSPSGSALPSPSLNSAGGSAEERQALPALPLILVASVAAAATAAAQQGRRRRARVVRAAAEESAPEPTEANLADRLDEKLKSLREREESLIARIAAVQDKIVSIEAPVEADAEAAEGEEGAEESIEDADMQALKAAANLAREAEKVAEAVESTVEEAKASTPVPPSLSSVEEVEAFKELQVLEQLADVHDDVTKREIEALEMMSGKKSMFSNLREAGRKLREKVDKEFREMREREAELLEKIKSTDETISETEQGEEETESKAKMELRVLESLASAYEDTTAEEIKALQRLADGK